MKLILFSRFFCGLFRRDLSGGFFSCLLWRDSVHEINVKCIYFLVCGSNVRSFFLAKLLLKLSRTRTRFVFLYWRVRRKIKVKRICFLVVFVPDRIQNDPGCVFIWRGKFILFFSQNRRIKLY